MLPGLNTPHMENTFRRGVDHILPHVSRRASQVAVILPPHTSHVSQSQPSAVASPSALPNADGSKLRPGMVIEHNRFGRGTITEVDTSLPDHRIKVEFDNSGEKLLLLKFAKFTILD